MRSWYYSIIIAWMMPSFTHFLCNIMYLEINETRIVVSFLLIYVRGTTTKLEISCSGEDMTTTTQATNTYCQRTWVLPPRPFARQIRYTRFWTSLLLNLYGPKLLSFVVNFPFSFALTMPSSSTINQVLRKLQRFASAICDFRIATHDYILHRRIAS